MSSVLAKFAQLPLWAKIGLVLLVCSACVAGIGALWRAFGSTYAFGGAITFLLGLFGLTAKRPKKDLADTAVNLATRERDRKKRDGDLARAKEAREARENAKAREKQAMEAADARARSTDFVRMWRDHSRGPGDEPGSSGGEGSR